MKRLYLYLAILGTLLPYFFLFRFIGANGLDLPLFLSQAVANPIARMLTADVLISSLVFWVFAYQESRRREIPYWWVTIIANLAVGLSLGLPLFLYLREGAAEKR